MDFRKDINGLRAIAVLAVLVFHFNPALIQGGFAGVDVFFVISGFLMTGIICKGLQQQQFSIISFYMARANRIIPALSLLCFCLICWGWFFLPAIDYQTLAQHVLSSVSFVSNIVYWRESGYFDAASHEKWLLHTWSLSAEWQFYILYPLILVFLNKLFSFNAIKRILLISTLLAFTFSVIATLKWPDPAYYLLPTRAWEMMMGGIAFLYPVIMSNKRKKIAEGLGLLLIVCSYFLISKNNLWPGYLAAIPVFGAFLVIIAQRNDSLFTANFIFQKIGKWSYSIYLWHWPLVVVIYYYALPSYYIYLGVILSLLLGYISYRYVEKLSFKKIDNWRQILFSKPFYMVLILSSLSFIIISTEGADIAQRRGASTPQAKFIAYYQEATKEENRFESYWLKCNTYSSLYNHNTLETAPECVEKSGDGGVFLWGDSHAESLSLGLRTLLTNTDIPFYQKTSAGCTPSLHETYKQKGKNKIACDHSNKLALESIEELKPALLIIAQKTNHDKTDWQALYNALSGMGVEKVLLVGPISQWSPSLPKVLIKPTNWNKNERFINDPSLKLSVIAVDKAMSQKALPSNITYFSMIDEICHEKQALYYCRVKTDNNDVLQIDDGHLSDKGSLYIVDQILSKTIMDLLAK